MIKSLSITFSQYFIFQGKIFFFKREKGLSDGVSGNHHHGLQFAPTLIMLCLEETDQIHHSSPRFFTIYRKKKHHGYDKSCGYFIANYLNDCFGQSPNDLSKFRI
jgi:hypothetical protein